MKTGNATTPSLEFTKKVASLKKLQRIKEKHKSSPWMTTMKTISRTFEVSLK
jgi:hypothetical protein